MPIHSSPLPLTNSHLYHYAGNNPIRYIDPDGSQDSLVSLETLKESRVNKFYIAQTKVSESLESFINILNNYNNTENFGKFTKLKESSMKWLKISLDNPEEIHQFAQTLGELKFSLDNLTSTSVKYDAHNSKNTAYVQEEFYGRPVYGTRGTKTLVLCDAFFFNETNREKVIVHEMSHYVLNTSDVSYDERRLPKLDKQNASNWGKFYEELSK